MIRGIWIHPFEEKGQVGGRAPFIEWGQETHHGGDKKGR